MSFYSKSIKYLVEHNIIKDSDGTILLVPAYSGLDIGFTTKFHDIDLAVKTSKQISDLAKSHKVLRYFEVEPVQVTNNQLLFQFNGCLSCSLDGAHDWDNLKWQLRVYELEAIEKNGLLKERNTSLFLNVEHFYLKYRFNCKTDQFEVFES